MDKTSVISQPQNDVSTHIAAKILGLKPRQVRNMCKNNIFKSAHRPGMGEHAHWMIARAEVLSRKLNPNVNRQEF